MSSATDPLVLRGYRAGTWKVDPSRSRIEFAIRQLFGKARGHFTDYDVTVETGERLEASSVRASLNLASIDTGNAKRDGHLRGPDFLKVDEHPTVTYRSTALQRTGGGGLVSGKLTIHGVGLSVPLSLQVKGFSTSPSGRPEAMFAASAQISRRAFGITIRMDGAGALISDKVLVRADICALLQQ